MRHLVTAALASALLSGGVEAATYTVSYDSSDGSAFLATLTTTDQADANGFFRVTALTGTRGGFAATLLAPGAFGGNDNLFKPTPDYLDVDGFAFSANGVGYDPYRTTVNATYPSGFAEFTGSNPSLTISNFVVRAAAGTVPEPATWATMVAGFGLVGVTARRRAAAPRRRPA